jgi:protein-S-isoprenylcysteine O-methyltransferase Ste14
MYVLKLIASCVLEVVLFGALLFLPAGTVEWWRAWVFLGVVFIAAAATMFGVFRGNEEFFNERLKSPIQNEQPLADKIVTPALVAAFFGLVIFIPLDVFRFHLMSKPGAGVSAAGLILFAAGWSIMTLALRENSFAAPVVKYQEARHQKVIDTGPYAIVRHPMYAGAVPLMIGMPLWLESYAAALLSVVPIGTVVARVLIEERFLRRELPGYDAYTESVRHRLVPFVW